MKVRFCSLPWSGGFAGMVEEGSGYCQFSKGVISDIKPGDITWLSWKK